MIKQGGCVRCFGVFWGGGRRLGEVKEETGEVEMGV